MRRLNITIIILFMWVTGLLASAVDQNRIMNFQHLTQLKSSELMERARHYRKANQNDSALILANIVAARYDERGRDADEQRLAVDAMAMMGNIYRADFSDYPRAYNYLNRALQLSRHHGLASQEAYVGIALALLYETELNTTDQPELTDTVVALLRHSYAKAVASESWGEVVSSAYNMAVCGYARGRLDDMQADLGHFLKHPIPAATHNLDYTRAFCRGVMALAAKRYDDALGEFERMKACISPQDSLTQLMNYLSNCAEVYYQTDQMEQALDLMYQIKELVELDDNKYDLMQVYGELSSYYDKMGDVQSARLARLEYLELKTQVQTTDRLKQIRDIRFLNQIDSMNLQLDRLAEAHKTQNRRLLMVSLVTLVIAVILGFLARAYRQLRHSNEALYEKNRLLLASEAPATPAPPAKYQSNQLTPEQTDRIYTKLRQAMQDTTLISDANLSLAQLSDLIGERQRDVSQVINSKLGVNFHTMLNEYRIKEACRLIDQTDAASTMTIEALAASVGIQSRSNFAVAFKRTTGLNPSEYIRIAKARKTTANG